MNTLGQQRNEALNRGELTDRLMGNVEIAQRMVNQFLNSSPQEIDLLESTIRIGHPQEIASLAHRHKGTAKTLAAARIAELSSEIEAQSGEGSISNLLSLLDALRGAHKQLQQELDDWASEPNDGATE